ncbi:hypothetical protein [Acetobacter aceti]|uniref:hypothetical protein n=1 Tax=Acetobacter aceti TaxID=435 RepID=UPI001624025C|nr:hypothetical protein [Acetobacter aceti]
MTRSIRSLVTDMAFGRDTRCVIVFNLPFTAFAVQQSAMQTAESVGERQRYRTLRGRMRVAVSTERSFPSARSKVDPASRHGIDQVGEMKAFAIEPETKR